MCLSKIGLKNVYPEHLPIIWDHTFYKTNIVFGSKQMSEYLFDWLKKASILVDAKHLWNS